MKNLFYVALMVIAGFSTACKKGPDNSQYKPPLQIAYGNGSFTYIGGTREIKPATDGIVEATVPIEDQSWCRITFVPGTVNTIEVIVHPYSGLESRSTWIHITDGERYRDFPITQTSVALDIQAEAFLSWNQAANFEVDLTPNDFPGTTAVSDATWLTAKYEKLSETSPGIIKLTATQNDGAERTASVTVTLGTQTKILKVTQRSKMTLSSYNIIFEVNTSTGASILASQNVNVTFADGASPGTITATPSETWLQANVNGTTVTISVDPTDQIIDRNATITLSNGTINATVNVLQHKRGINASDVYGVYDVGHWSYMPVWLSNNQEEWQYFLTNYYEKPQPVSSDVIIKPKVGGGSNEVTITGLFNGPSLIYVYAQVGPVNIPKTLSFDGILDLKNKKITVAGKTPVTDSDGAVAFKNSTIGRNDGTDFDIYIDDQGKLSTDYISNWLTDSNAQTQMITLTFELSQSGKVNTFPIEWVFTSNWTRTAMLP